MPTDSGRLISLQCPTYRLDHFYIADAEGRPATHTGDGIDMAEYELKE